MSEKVLNDVNALLNEEKWTRATLSNYTISNFQELDKELEIIQSHGIQDEVRTLCNEHLEQTKNSVAALYLAGLISLSKQLVDDSQLITLINIFSDSQKWAAVEYLCQKILEFSENKMALRVLAGCLFQLERVQEMYEVWERLIKVDYSEADIVLKIAENYEQTKENEKAIIYYRKAIHRFVNKSHYNQVRDIWKRLVDLGVDDYEFFFLIEKKVAKSMSQEKAVQLLEDLYPVIKEKENWDFAIDLLKRILNYDSRNNWARQEITTCYRMKFAKHSQLEEYIRLSNLNQSWRNILEAIADFEKHISFDAGNFVFHKTWGVGIIKSIAGDEITIDFVTKRGHTMSLKMAVGALLSLGKDHIWVLKSIRSKEKLKIKAKSDIPWALRTIMKSFNNVADMKKIKAELVPSLLTPGEWSSWSPEARKILKTDPAFGNVPDKLDQFVVRDKPMSFEEKTFNQFKAEKDFFKKVQAVRDFLDHSEPDSEFFAEIFRYFTGFLKAGNVTTPVVGSYLLVSRLSRTYPFLNPNLDWGFNELWGDLEYPSEIFAELDDVELRKEFLLAVRGNLEDWPQVYLELFPIQPSRSLLEEVLAAGFAREVKTRLEEVIDHYREYREAFIWLTRNHSESTWLVEMDIRPEKLLIAMIHLMDQTFRDIANKRDASLNRKLNRQIQTYLFKENHLETFLLQGDKGSAIRIYTLLEDVKDLAPGIKIDTKAKIVKKFPNIRFYDEKKAEIPTASSSRYFYAVPESLKAKQKELKNIIEVEIPKNSKEIGQAIELGDLSENAEYKAGKEKQENLQIQVGKLKEELERVRLFDAKERDQKKINFGAVIKIKSLKDDQEESYTILGPWESDPSQKVISYLSPFGSSFLGHKEGEELDFVINEREYEFRILGISWLF